MGGATLCLRESFDETRTLLSEAKIKQDIPRYRIKKDVLPRGAFTACSTTLSQLRAVSTAHDHLGKKTI